MRAFLIVIWVLLFLYHLAGPPPCCPKCGSEWSYLRGGWVCGHGLKGHGVNIR